MSVVAVIVKHRCGVCLSSVCLSVRRHVLKLSHHGTAPTRVQLTLGRIHVSDASVVAVMLKTIVIAKVVQSSNFNAQSCQNGNVE